MKNKKIIFNLIKLTIVIGLIFLVSKNISKIDFQDWLNLKVLNFDYLFYAFILVFINWGIEWTKWIKTIELIQLKNAKTKIEIDGGVTNQNAKQLIDAGADVLVAGSYVFKAQNPTQTIQDLKKIMNS